MTQLVLDTSVLVKWFADEQDHQRAKKLLQDSQNRITQVYIPDLAVIELSNALYYSHGYSQEELSQAIEALHLIEIEILDVDKPVLETAVELMTKHGVAMYDSVFMALASQLAMPLVTADKKHHKKSYYLKIIYLDEL